MQKILMLPVFLFCLFACGVAFAGQTAYLEGNNDNSQSQGGFDNVVNSVGMANPASVYCGKMGGKTNIIIKDDGSQYGICIFPDGSQCEEWAYYKGECENSVGPAQTSSETVVHSDGTTTSISSGENQISTSYNTQVQTQTTNMAIVRCAVDDSLNQELNQLLVMLKGAESKNDTESMTQIKLKITAVSEESNKKLTQCQSQQQIQTTTQTGDGSQNVLKPTVISATTTSAASLICEVPAELQKEYDYAWSIYKTAIANGDDQAAIDSKPAIAKAEENINAVKMNCAGKTISAADSTSTTSSGQGVGTSAMENGTCIVPVELTQEFEGQWKKYNTAIANNDTEAAIATKARIAEIEQKLSSTKGQCVKTIVSSDAKTSDVVSYYKEKMTETLSTTGDVDTQIEALKQLRAEIDNTIADLIRKKSEFNASDATGLVDTITVKKNEIMAGSVSIANPTASINTNVNSKEVKVKSTSTGASITEGGINVAVQEATIEQNKLMVGANEVKVLPSQVRETARIAVTSMTMATENGKAVYNANGTEKRNLFAVFPVEIEKSVKVDAENGNMISENKPWWSVLTTESQ